MNKILRDIKIDNLLGIENKYEKIYLENFSNLTKKGDFYYSNSKKVMFNGTYYTYISVVCCCKFNIPLDSFYIIMKYFLKKHSNIILEKELSLGNVRQ